MLNAHLEEHAAAFALDALEPDERRLVEAHLRDCPRCALAVDRAQRVAGLLGFATEPQGPPAGHYERFLRRVATEQPLSRRRAPVRLAIWRQRFALAAAAVLVVGLGAWNLSLNQELNSQQQLARLVAEGEPRELSTTTVKSDVHGRAFVEPSTNQVLISVSRLPELPANRTYQIWFTPGEGGPVSGGTFRVGADGTAAVVAAPPGGLRSYVGIGVTTEPLGGSNAPSTPMLMYWHL